jgi:hypothetical protein
MKSLCVVVGSPSTRRTAGLENENPLRMMGVGVRERWDHTKFQARYITRTSPMGGFSKRNSILVVPVVPALVTKYLTLSGTARWVQ